MNIVSRTSQGFLAPFNGLKLILSSPKNFAYSVIPFLIGLAFFVIGTTWFMRWCQEGIDSWLSSIEFIKDWKFIGALFSFVVLTLAFILASLLSFLLSYVCIIIVGGPFFALMVENIFEKEAASRQLRGSLSLVFNMFLMALGKTLVFAIIGIFCLIMAFFPVLNIISAYLAILLIAFDCADYAFEIDFLSLRQRFRFLGKHIWEFSGLSLAILATTLVPGSFFILLPAFICGATKMYIQLSRKAV